jgi:hypothetical protein
MLGMWRYFVLAIIACAALRSTSASADSTIKSLTTVTGSAADGGGRNPGSFEEVLYVQGNNLRRERTYSSPNRTARLHLIIERCDEGVVYEVDPVAREYVRHKTLSKESPEEQQEFRTKFAGSGAATSETKDTGETQEMFGHQARRSVTKVSLGTGRGAEPVSKVVDGWYLQDVSAPRECPSSAKSDSVAPVKPTVEPPLPSGLPVRTTTTVSSMRPTPLGSVPTGVPRVFTITREVTELSDAPLDPMLFQPPPGFRKVKQISQKAPPLPSQ